MILIVSKNNLGYGSSSIDVDKIVQAAKKDNAEVFQCTESWKVPDHFKGTAGTVYNPAFGVVFCEYISRTLIWSIYQNSLDWVPKLPSFFLKRSVDYLGEARAYNYYFPNKKDKFIQSADGERFSPHIIKSGSRSSTYSLNVWSPIIASDVVDFCSEYVCLVHNKKVEDFAFMRGFEQESPVPFVNRLLDTVKSAPSFTIRVGEIKNRGWAVINTKPIWASPVYGMDTGKFWQALKASCK